MSKDVNQSDVLAKLKAADQRRNRAAMKGVLAAVLAWLVGFAVLAILFSLRPGGTLLDVITLVWQLGFMPMAGLLGFFVYRKSR